MKPFRNKTLNNSAGITLIEMIVTLLILSIVMIAIFTFFKFGNQMMINGKGQYIIQSETRLAISEIISDVRYANEISLIDTATAISEKGGTDYSYIYITDDTVYRSVYNQSTGSRTENEIGDTFLVAECYFAKSTGLQNSLYIQLSSQYNDRTYSVDATINLPNLILSSPTIGIQGASSSKAIKFKVPSE